MSESTVDTNDLAARTVPRTMTRGTLSANAGRTPAVISRISCFTERRMQCVGKTKQLKRRPHRYIARRVVAFDQSRTNQEAAIAPGHDIGRCMRGCSRRIGRLSATS